MKQLRQKTSCESFTITGIAIRCVSIMAMVTLLLNAPTACAEAPWSPVYATDFTTNPNWTTSHPSSYSWNSGASNYTLTMADASESFATTTVALTPHQSFKFEFDLNISRLDWAGDINFGLYGAMRHADPQDGPHPLLTINFGNGDLGNGIRVSGFDAANAYYEMNQYPSSFALNTWYHATLVFDHDTKTITVGVTRKSDGQVIWSSSTSCVQDFAGLIYFGASKVGDDYAPGATGVAIIDNVTLSQRAWVPVYATDFATNPGWTTSHPSSYFWNSVASNYTLTMVDKSESYATTPVALTPHQSVKFEFDVNISHLDWAGDINCGLYGALRHADPQDGPHPLLTINFGTGDLGNGIRVSCFDGSSTYHELNQYPSPFALNTWYHAGLVFDRDAGTITASVVRKSDCQLIWSNSVAGVQDFADLVYFGASKVGDDYAPGATGVAIIDNVALFESPPKASIRFSAVEICWPSRTNAVYAVQYCTNLTANS
jgi:hypothetical protein